MSPSDVPVTGTETREDLARSLIALGFDRRQSASVVNAIVEVLCDRLAAGEDVGLRGFGRFTVLDKTERPVRNPRTGEAVTLAPRSTVTFHPAAGLRARLTAALCSTPHRRSP